MDFEQMYIPHEYIELKMQPGRDAQGNATFRIDPNHLHIWPRHSFMFIALPNQVNEFLITLFPPESHEPLFLGQVIHLHIIRPHYGIRQAEQPRGHHTMVQTVLPRCAALDR